jgi:hypothetical protein
MDHGGDPENDASRLWEALVEAPELEPVPDLALPGSESLLAWLDSVQNLVGADTRK